MYTRNVNKWYSDKSTTQEQLSDVKYLSIDDTYHWHEFDRVTKSTLRQ